MKENKRFLPALILAIRDTFLFLLTAVKENKRFLSIWLPPIVWSGLIFLISSLPFTLEVGVPITFVDKLAHFFIYMPLGFLVSRAFYLSQNEKLKKNFIILTLVFCLLYAASDEFHQLFVKNRQAEIWDVFFDFFGSGSGLIIFNFFKKRVI